MSNNREQRTMNNAQRPYRIVLVEDSEILCRMMVDLLTGLGNIEIQGHATNEKAAIALLADARPDLVVIDIELKPGSGLSVLSAVVAAPDVYGAPIIVVYSNHAQPVVQARCKALGAAAFYDKAFQLDELLDFVAAQAQA